MRGSRRAGVDSGDTIRSRSDGWPRYPRWHGGAAFAPTTETTRPRRHRGGRRRVGYFRRVKRLLRGGRRPMIAVVYS